MSFVIAKAQIKGLRPFWYHCFTPDTLPLEKREKTGVPGNDPEEWKRTFLATDDGKLCMDPSYIFGCLRDAAKYTKKGKASLQRTVSATLVVMSDNVIFNRELPERLEDVTFNPNDDVYIDCRSVRNPTTGARNIRYRLAMSPGWETEFVIAWESTLVSRSEMNGICRDAGMLSGLGDGRSIGYGRFEVVNFAVIDESTSYPA